MQKIIAALKQNGIFFGGFLAILFVASVFLFMDGGFLSSPNNHHTFYLNVLLINYTFMGDGFFALCLPVVMIFYYKRRKTGFTLLYAFFICSLAIQLIKNLDNLPGPKLYFEAGTYLNFINNTTFSGNTGYISGHTAMAFSIATVLVLMMNSKKLQLLILPGVILLAYSRMYLAQHSLFDVVAGAIVGTVSGILSFYLVQNRITINRPVNHIHTSATGNIQTA